MPNKTWGPKRKANIEFWGEFARRKLMFHKDETPEKIRMWGLLSWGYARPWLEQGLIVTDMVKANQTIWTWPTVETYQTYIKPLLDAFTVEELTYITGWSKEFPESLRGKVAPAPFARTF